MTLASRLLYEPLPVLRGVVLVAAAVVIAVVAFDVVPKAPSNLGVARPPVNAVVGPAPDAGSLVPTEGSAFGGGAAGCLTPIQRGATSMDVCWQAYRVLTEEDASQDYYALEVTATAHGTESGGIKWAVLWADASAALSNIVTDQQFVELGAGQCRNVLAAGGSGFMSMPNRIVTACENWRTGPPSDAYRTVRTTWDCAGCSAGVIGNRDVSLVHLVSTQSGVVPKWELSADLGG